MPWRTSRPRTGRSCWRTSIGPCVPGGHLYITVEEAEDSAIDAAFSEAVANGLPIVRGEVIEGDTAGYHYYPGREQVMAWLAAEGLHVVAEGFDQEEGWGYRHLLLRSDV